MKGDKDRVLECTTGTFDGLIAMVNPQDSWVVSWDLKHMRNDAAS
jgi:transcription elongation factor SPT4